MRMIGAFSVYAHDMWVTEPKLVWECEKCER
jgi:hypothetical protein